MNKKIIDIISISLLSFIMILNNKNQYPQSINGLTGLYFSKGQGGIKASGHIEKI